MNTQSKRLGKTGITTRQLVVAGMLGGISAFMALTGLGYFSLGVVSVTVLHIPVLIATALEGPVVGLCVALIFGLSSMFRAMTAAVTPIDLLFTNPLISVLPRLLIVPCAYGAYQLLLRLTKKNNLGVGAAAIAGTLANAVFVLGALALIYGGQIAENTNALFIILGTALLTNTLPEILASVLICVPVAAAVRAVFYRKSR